MNKEEKVKQIGNNKCILVIFISILILIQSTFFTSCYPEKSLNDNISTHPITSPAEITLINNMQTGIPEPTGQRTDNKIKFSDITITEGLYVDVPEQFDICDFIPVEINQNTLNSFIDKLSECGWNNHIIKASDIQGLYLIKSDVLGNGFDNESDFNSAIDDFFQDSGLQAYLNSKGFILSNKNVGEQDEYTKFYWLDFNGYQTNSYIRINMEDNRTCSECKIYLCESIPIGKADSVPIEQAMEHAFLINAISSDISNYKYKVNAADIKYINGLPYYHFNATGVDVLLAVEGYAPAISYDEIMSNEDLYNQYLDFTN